MGKTASILRGTLVSGAFARGAGTEKLQRRGREFCVTPKSFGVTQKLRGDEGGEQENHGEEREEGSDEAHGPSRGYTQEQYEKEEWRKHARNKW